MKHISFQVTFLFFFLLTTTVSFAQLVPVPSTNANTLAQSLVGSGVVVSNATLVSSSTSAGTFTQTGTNIGINSGIMLTSGDITLAPGPNMGCCTGTDNGLAGDPDLAQISGFASFNATILEFDVTVTADTLKFNYVFASDEYNDYVGSTVNDAFGFFISGPGISGPFSNNSENIALIPGTSTGMSINFLNCGSYGQYYVCNDPWDQFGGGCTTQCPTDPNSTTIEYDGFTVPMQAIAVVQACNTYHLKLAVADAGDGIFDSGVFIEEGSLNAVGNAVVGVTGYVDPVSNQPAVVEGCDDGAFNFTLPAAQSDTFVIHYTVGGTATMGTDYNNIADSVVFLPGDTTISVPIIPVNDGIAETPETIVVYLYLSCSPDPYDSAVIYILDSLVADAGPDTSICQGQSTQLHAELAAGYSWAPSTGLSCNNCQDPIASPNATTTYTLTITFGSCTTTDEVTVHVDSFQPVDAGADIEVCEGQTAQLNATGANSYTWIPGATLSCTDCANPIASPTQTTNYVVQGTNACFTSYDTIQVTVHPSPTATVSGDTAVCPFQPVQLNAGGGVTYSWSPGEYLDDSTIFNPVAIVDQAVTFTVTVTNQFGCSDVASSTISTIGSSDHIITNDTIIYLGNSVVIQTSGGVSFEWNPPDYLDDPFGADPLASPLQTTTYYVQITNDAGCVILDSVTIIVNDEALVQIPNAFSPNSDGVNDFFNLLYRGIFNLSEFTIYNRWGEEVFTTSTLGEGWDGTYKGEPQEVGVYVYFVSGSDYHGNPITRQGNLTLVR